MKANAAKLYVNAVLNLVINGLPSIQNESGGKTMVAYYITF